jgi:HK97 family phage portal protein
MGVISRISSWFGGGIQAAGNPGDDRYFEPWAGPTGAGVAVTAESALKCAAVFRCVTILSDTLSTQPFGMFQLKVDGQPDSGMDSAPNHPINDIIGMHPNPRNTAAEFWGTMMLHAVLRGVAYAEIKPGPRGFANSLEFIHPDRIEQPIEVLGDGTLRFKIRDPKSGTVRILLQEEMLRIPGLSSDGITGLRTIDLAAESIALLMAADQYAARVFSQNLNMGGFITHPGKLSKEGGERLITRLMQKFAGIGNAHRPMILQEGMTYKKAAMTASEAQLLEARKAQVREIANYFGGVPLHLLGIDDQTNRSTVEEQSLNFVRYTIRPWAERIEQAVRRDLILAPRRYIAKFNLDEIERGNMAARAEYFSKALGSGGSPPWLTQNEVRASEGWNKRPESHADELAMGTNPGQDKAAPPAAAPAAEDVTPAPAAIQFEGQATASIGSSVAVVIAEPVVAAETAAPAAAPVDPLVLQAAELGRKETAALRRLHIRHAADTAAFRKAVVAFYGGFASQVATKLEVTKPAAKAWCKKRSDRVCAAEDIVSVIDAMESDFDAADTASVGERTDG